MATSVQNYYAKINGRDSTLATLNVLPGIPANAVLDDVTVNCYIYRDGGPVREIAETRFYLGSYGAIVEKTNVGHGTTDYNFSIKSYVVNNGGTLSYANGASGIEIKVKHNWVIGGDADWTLKEGSNITASYTIPTYTLTVTSNNTTYGTVTGGNTYENGATATLTATANKGYKFVKWNDGSTSATRTVTVSANATYTATFEPITYYVAFDGNGATSGSVATITTKYDQDFTLPENGFAKKITAAWNANADGVTLEYSYLEKDCVFNGWKFSLSQSTIWAPGNKFGKYASDDGATVTVYADWSSCTFTHPTATRKGYNFKGWNTKADGSGIPYTADYIGTSSNMTLYAQWEKAEPVFTSVTITRSTDLAQVTINTPVEAGAKYIISVEVT